MVLSFSYLCLNRSIRKDHYGTDPRKDVDGFHPENFGKMALEMDTFLPATPFGILTLLERYNIETKGKDCVIIGRSRIVGRPMSILMGRKDFPEILL